MAPNSNQPLTALQFWVQLPYSEPQQLIVDADRAVIGSGAHCEIRLPAELAAVEHVVVKTRDGRVYAQARAPEPQALLNGAPFSRAEIPPDALLQIGDCQIAVALVTLGEKKEEASTASRVRMYALAAISGLLLAYLLLGNPFDNGIGRWPSVPMVWDGMPASCPHAEKDEAVSMGFSKKLAAEGKRERSPFDVRDGVNAVPLFELASVCFRTGGDNERAEEMRTAAEQLKKQINLDFRAHQARLIYALDTNDLRTAMDEVKILMAMTQGRETPYTTWLASVDRHLKVAASGEKKS